MTTAATTAVIPAPSHQAGLSISPHDFELVLHNNYDEASAEILRFWFFTAKQNNWSLKKIASVAGISSTVIYRLFRGEYPADPTNALATLDAARQTIADAAENPDFIETALWKRMSTIFDKTRALRNVSILWGRMGIGKTECLKEYARRSPVGRTAIVRFPAGSSFPQFVQHVGNSLGIAKVRNATYTRERIIKLLGMGQRLLIIDELHQAFLTTRSDTSVRCCEFLREIGDVAECGLVLIGTELLEENLFRGPHKDALRQLIDRGTVQVPLPPKPTQQDIRKFLKAYGLDFPETSTPAAEILNDILRSAGLRKLTLHLRDGLSYANKRQEPYTWDHFTAAFEAIVSLSR